METEHVHLVVLVHEDCRHQESDTWTSEEAKGYKQWKPFITVGHLVFEDEDRVCIAQWRERRTMSGIEVPTYTILLWVPKSLIFHRYDHQIDICQGEAVESTQKG